MNAGFFPSAHSFNSSVLAKVKFAVRAMEVPTGALRLNLSSPAWMAIVASARRRLFASFFMVSQLAAAGRRITSANLARVTPNAPPLPRDDAVGNAPGLRDNVARHAARDSLLACEVANARPIRRAKFLGACTNVRHAQASNYRFLDPVRALLADRVVRRKTHRQAARSRRAAALRRVHGRGILSALPGKSQ